MVDQDISIGNYIEFVASRVAVTKTPETFDIFGIKFQKTCNYSGVLIGLPIAILYFLTRKITAEGAEER
jgi:hypothetical protein